MSQMTSFQSETKFWAREYFPKGIARSGHFTKEQASLLEAHGKSYEALSKGLVLPKGEEEKAFVEVCLGEREAQSVHEKTWKRFLTVINEKHRIQFSVSSSSSSPSVDFSEPVDAGS